MRRRQSKLPPNQVLGGDSFFKPKVQPKLAMGSPGDKYEVEADHMADKVVNKTGSGEAVQKMEGEEEVQQKPLAESVTPLVQKMEASEEEAPVQKMEEEESVQMMEEEEPVQKMEEEEPVQKMEKEEPVQMMEEEEPVQMMEEEEPVQKMEEEEPVQAMEEEEAVQTKKGDNTSTNSTVEGKLRKGSGGTKMDSNTKSEMESGFGADFSNVNIHNDSEAAQMSQAIGAQAFTHGNDIYFNEGKYNPTSDKGKHLLAHELTHTIQQKGVKQNNAIQCDFAVEPTTPNRKVRNLNESQIKKAIAYNKKKHKNATEIALIRDILGLSPQPAVINASFVRAVVEYQSIYGLSRDGKIGGQTADRLAREIIAEADFLGNKNLGTLGPEFSLKTSLRTLINANNSNYVDYKAAIKGGTMIQRFIVLRDKQLLKDLKAKLSWNNFARCIELLGYKAPTYNQLIRKSVVKTVLRQAWNASNVGMNPPAGAQHEEGGWAYLNLISGRVSVRRAPRGAGASISLTAPPNVANSVVVAKFHTHPNLINPAGGPLWISGPSPQDIAVDARHGVPDIVVGSPDTDTTTFQLYLSGPKRRKHLAGNRGLPGATGGLSPQGIKGGSFDEQ